MRPFPRRALLAALCLCPILCCADDSLDFVHLSDAHLTDLSAIHPALAPALQVKKDSTARLPRLLNDLRARVQPSFVLITGDLIDGYLYEGPEGQPVPGPMETFQRIFERSPIPIYPTLGNHDITRYHHEPNRTAPVADQLIASDARAAWMRSIPNFSEGTYYTFSKQVGATKYLFLVLDDGDGMKLNAEYAAAQLAWIKRQLRGHGGEKIILAMHIPLAGANFWDGLRPVLAETPNLVLAIAGHRHSDGLDEVDLGARQLLQVRTAALFQGENNWRKFRLREDRIQIFATGKPDEVVREVPLQNSVLLKRGAGR